LRIRNLVNFEKERLEEANEGLVAEANKQERHLRDLAIAFDDLKAKEKSNRFRLQEN
jgi:hypothetical protein